MFCTIKFVYYKSFCVRDDIGSYIRTVYHMVSHTPKRKVGGSNPFWRATSNAESLCFQGLSAFIFVKNEKNEKPQFFIGFFRLLTEFMTDVVRLSGGFFYVIRCVFL